MAYTVSNPSAANVFFTTAGVAISSTTQPDVTAGRAIGLYSNRSLLNSVGLGVATPLSFQGSKVYSSKGTGAFSAKLGSNVTGATVAASGGKAVFTKNTHGLLAGQSVYVSDTNNKVTGIHYIISKDTNTFSTQFPYTSGAGTITYKPMSGTFAYGTGVGNRYSVARKLSTTINGVSNTALLSGGAPDNYRKSPKNLMGARAQGVALAIRNSYWSIYSGSWTTQPTSTNSSLGNVAGATLTNTSTDNAVTSRSIAGELVYRSGKPAPVMADYGLPTA